MLDIQPSQSVPNYAFKIGDELVLDGVSWTVQDRREKAFVLLQNDGAKIAQEFTATQLAYYANQGKLKHLPRDAIRSDEQMSHKRTADFLGSRTEQEHRDAFMREACVMALLEFKRKGEVKYTYESIEDAIYKIQLLAGQIFTQKKGGWIEAPAAFSAKSLLRWKKKHSIGGLASLYDKKRLRGNRNAQLLPEVNAILQPIVCEYMMAKGKTKALIFEDVKNAFEVKNLERHRKGLPKLPVPSRQTVFTRINELDPFEVMYTREGPEAARKAFGPVRGGPEVFRPLERVEIDEWTADLRTYLSESGILDRLTKEELAAMKLDKNKPMRVLVTIAIDVATKCIVGMKISPTATIDSALQCVEMITEDKGSYADAVGALTPWDMYGRPALIVTDCAQYNISNRTKQAIAAFGSKVLHCPAGTPEMKGAVERIFKTISIRLLPRLSGRTFSDVVSKGDYDPGAQAALTTDDFCSVLVRWVVDVYHRTPHRGLGGETPFDAWRRLSNMYGVLPSPDAEQRRIAFGYEESRILQRNGITIMNIPYHGPHLARHKLRSKETRLTCRWHPSDLGSIFVFLDNEWVTVEAMPRWAKGLTASEWEHTVQELNARRRRGEEVSAPIIAHAISEIQAVNSESMRRKNITADIWPRERAKRLEDSMLDYFDAIADSGPAMPDTAAATEASGDGFGITLAVPVKTHSKVPGEEGAAPRTAHRGERAMVDGGVGSRADKVSSQNPTAGCPAPRKPTRRNRGRDNNDDGFTFEDK